MHPHRPERRGVARGDRAPHHDRDVAGVRRPEPLEEAPRQREVRAREHRQADDVHVLLDRLGDQLVGRPLEPRVHDLDPGVPERVRDDLGPAVVPVEAGLRDQHPERTVRHPGVTAGVKAGR